MYICVYVCIFGYVVFYVPCCQNSYGLGILHDLIYQTSRNFGRLVNTVMQGFNMRSYSVLGLIMSPQMPWGFYMGSYTWLGFTMRSYALLYWDSFSDFTPDRDLS